MANPLDWIQEEIRSLKDAGFYNNIRTISSPQGAWLEIDGQRYLNFCSNNYLGLANHPHMVEAAKAALDRYGVGPGAVRVISGTNDLHIELERRMAQFKGVEAAITLQSGFQANTAAIASLISKKDFIFSDKLNHASIIDGCRLSGGKVVPYEHCDVVSLEAVIKENLGSFRRAMIITDGVFSMDGDVAPLDKIYEVANRHGVLLMVDDAHGEGVLGRGGRGIVDHFGLHGKVDVEVGTMSKAFGVVGGVVAGKAAIIEWLRQRGRPFMFSSAVTPADAAACLAAIDLLEASTDLVDRLWNNARYFKDEMKKLGFDLGVSTTPITPVMLGEAPLAQRFSRDLFENGVFAMANSYPIVPQGKARIRVMISAAHEMDDLNNGLEMFARVGHSLGVI